MTHNLKRTIALSLVVATTFALTCLALCASSSSQERQSLGYRFALTKQGAICEGTLVDCGATYSVEFQGGGSITVSKLDVVFIGETRAEIYEYQKSKTRLEDVNEVLKLADWAARRALTNEALATLETTLNNSQDAAERNALSKKIKELREAERFREQAAQMKSAAEARARQTNAHERKPEQQKKMTDEERALDEWGDALPHAEIERFARKAAPVLQKRCALAECHSEMARGARYRIKPKAIGAAQRLALLYNLRETTRYVNFNALETSEILNHPEIIDARGSRVYPFGDDRNSARDCEAFLTWFNALAPDSKLAQLAAQYRSERENNPILRDSPASRYDYETIANPQPTTQPLSPGDEESGFASLFDEQTPPNAPNLQQGADASLPQVFQQGIDPEIAKLASQPQEDVNSPEAALRRANLAPQKTYRDAFDPNIFNDRYHPDKK